MVNDSVVPAVWASFLTEVGITLWEFSSGSSSAVPQGTWPCWVQYNVFILQIVCSQLELEIKQLPHHYNTFDKGIHPAQFQVSPQVGHPEQPREGGAGISRILHCSTSHNTFLVVEQQPTIFSTRTSNSFILRSANLAHMELISSTLIFHKLHLEVKLKLQHKIKTSANPRICIPRVQDLLFLLQELQQSQYKVPLVDPQVTLLKLCSGWGSTITLPAAGSLGRVCRYPGMEQHILQGQAMEGVVLQELGN